MEIDLEQKSPSIEQVSDLLAEIACQLMTRSTYHADYSEYFANGKNIRVRNQSIGFSDEYHDDHCRVLQSDESIDNRKKNKTFVVKFYACFRTKRVELGYV